MKQCLDKFRCWNGKEKQINLKEKKRLRKTLFKFDQKKCFRIILD